MLHRKLALRASRSYEALKKQIGQMTVHLETLAIYAWDATDYDELRSVSTILRVDSINETC